MKLILTMIALTFCLMSCGDNSAVNSTETMTTDSSGTSGGTGSSTSPSKDGSGAGAVGDSGSMVSDSTTIINGTTQDSAARNRQQNSRDTFSGNRQ